MGVLYKAKGPQGTCYLLIAVCVCVCVRVEVAIYRVSLSLARSMAGSMETPMRFSNKSLLLVRLKIDLELHPAFHEGVG